MMGDASPYATALVRSNGVQTISQYQRGSLMITRAELHANFSLTTRATAIIRSLMDQIAEEDGEYPEALAIKWARIIFNDGVETPYGVHIGFYDKTDFPGHDATYWTIINGIKIVFMMDEPIFPHFYGKTLDIEETGQCILRDHPNHDSKP
jgi:hypothetical protein